MIRQGLDQRIAESVLHHHPNWRKGRKHVDSKRKPWTTPVLRTLGPSDERIRRAVRQNPAFAAALDGHRDADSEARPLAV